VTEAGHPEAGHPEDVCSSWSPSGSPDGTRLAFVSDRSGDPSVWIKGPQPEALTALETGGLRMLTVSWSPDGAWLACVTAASGSTRSEVWLVRPDGSDLHLAAGAAPAAALLGSGAGNGWTADCRLIVTETVGLVSTALLLDPQSGGRQTVTQGPLIVLLDASRDLNRVLLRVGSRGQRQLVGCRADGSGRRPVVTGAGPGSVDRGCLSPDGRTIYARSDVGRELAALVAVDAEGGRPATVLAERPDAELEDVVPAPDAAACHWCGTCTAAPARSATSTSTPAGSVRSPRCRGTSSWSAGSGPTAAPCC
jgi:hypothetical protein